ncbi:MAG: DUF192 domain-containing protein [Chloroflexota bacterium]
MASTKVMVTNISTGERLADRADLANNLFTRGRGLLGRAGLDPGEGLVLQPCGSVHCLGMRFAIDVLHLDRDGLVVRVVRNLRPNRLGPIVRHSHIVVELPVGSADNTSEGDRVEIRRAA